MRLARRAGPKKAKMTLARKLAVILHRMHCDGTRFKLAETPTAERPARPHRQQPGAMLAALKAAHALPSATAAREREAARSGRNHLKLEVSREP